MSWNRPGLSAVSYRLGTYAGFRAAMLARLRGSGGLEGLTTRADDDYSVTLIDLWAAVADILSFYQERYANESFIRTARQADSVASLASLTVPAGAADAAAPAAGIGVPMAGVAATVRLLLTADRGAVVDVPAGLRVQSLPGPGEQPQVFELLQQITADWRFNRLRISPGSEPVQPFAPLTASALLAPAAGPALSAALKAGDRVVLTCGDGAPGPLEEKQVAAVSVAEDRVTLAWKTPVQVPEFAAAKAPRAFRFTRTFKLFGCNAPATYASPGRLDTPVSARLVDWKLNALTDFSYPQSDEEGPPLGLLGDPVDVDGRPVVRLCLDARYRGIEPGQQLLVADLSEDPSGLASAAFGPKTRVQVVRTDEVEDAFGPLTATVTRVWVASVGAGGLPPGMPDRRKVVVYQLDREILFSASTPATRPGAWTDTVVLRGRHPSGADGQPVADRIEVGLAVAKGGFQPGVVLAASDFALNRELVLSDANGLVQIAAVAGKPEIVPDPDDPSGGMALLRLPLDAPPAVDPATAVAMGNLALAGHGQTVSGEVLGSADGSAAFQTLQLKRRPLTFVPASGGGVRSTLQVSVDGVPWTEVARLGGQAPRAAVYATSIAADGTVTVRFGDGVSGRIPPTGRGNVTAVYRYGSGAAGNVRAGALTTLLDRPTGLLAATNPLPASGGADAGAAETIRQAAAQAVRTFGRVVTLTDVEDVAMGVTGVAKAQAAHVFDGHRNALVVTLAGPGGQPPDRSAFAAVGTALAAAHGAPLPLMLTDFQPVPLAVSARLTAAPGFAAADVVRAARQAVTDALSFEALQLGQVPDAAQVGAVLRAVPGVGAIEQLSVNVKPGAVPGPPAVGAQRAPLAVVEAPGQDISIMAGGGTP